MRLTWNLVRDGAPPWLFALWVEELLRTPGVHIGLGYERGAGIDIGRHLLALRCGERSLDAVIAHAERVLDHEPGDRVALQEFDEFIVRANAHDINLVARCTLGHGLTHGLRHDRVRNEHTAQVPR